MGQVAQLLCILIAITAIVGICVLLYLAQQYFSRRANLFEKAIRKCYDYVKLACNLDNTAPNKNKTSNRTAKLISGRTAEEKEFPHMAYLSITTTDDKRISCGGSLISDEFILTAAQCVQNTNINGISVKLGSVFRTSNKTGEFFRVSKIIIHRFFSKISENTYINDIALLQLSKKVTFKETVRPICLAPYVGHKNLNLATVTGWGVDNSGKLSELLKKLKAFMGPTIQQQCKNVWGDHFEYNDEMICAGHPKYDRGLCQGDFGGPLQHLYDSLSEECPNVYEQFGIASMSNHQCGPGSSNETYIIAYTRVQGFIPWIVDIIWAD